MRKLTLTLVCMAFLLHLPIVGAAEQLTDLPSGSPLQHFQSPINSSGLYGGMVSYDDVALIVNDDSPVSRDIGTYFAEKRGIPPERIINITTSTSETINTGQFDDMAGQISGALAARGLTDSINYLVTTKGVPLRVSGNNWRQASVDSELMLVDSPDESAIHGGWRIDNPYFQAWKPFSREDYGIRLVTRLTGYTADEAKRLVDLADGSYGSRGNALLDMDPGKDSDGGYKIANDWMRRAHTWLIDNNHSSLLDENRTFRTDWNDTMAYFSWGSNDGSWGTYLLSNTGMESGNGGSPSSWTIVDEGGPVVRSSDTAGGGTWSLKMTRNSTGPVLAFQDYAVQFPDHRFILDGEARLYSVGSPGARIYVVGLDARGGATFVQELYNRSGTRNWESAQDPVENRTGTVLIRVVAELMGDGTAHFDDLVLRVIRPHNRWLPGAIAETCVSTGGRTMTYDGGYGQSLVADLVRDGVTGIKGYTVEPFLDAISHADILIPAYYQSYNLAESFWMGSEYSSWMGTVIGDPKCTPFIDIRPDMGFNATGPMVPSVDEKGDPFLRVTFLNTGGSSFTNGLVELYMDGVLLDTRAISIDGGMTLSVDYPMKQLPADIQGTHEFRAVLNSDGHIREMDASNNILELNLTVNSIPILNVYHDPNDISRPGNLTVYVVVMDIDLGFDRGMLDFSVSDYIGRTMEAHLADEMIDGSRVTYAMNVSFPPDSLLGYYDIEARYTDEDQSFAHVKVGQAFRLVNSLPTLVGYLQFEEMGRGEMVLANLSWSDADTPDGDLDLSVTITAAMGSRIDPAFVDVQGSKATIGIETSSQFYAQTWRVDAQVTDRDGAKALWSGTFKTVNRPPSLSIVSGLPRTMNRLEDLNVTVLYTDTEGMQADEFELTVIQGVHEGGQVLYTISPEMVSGIPKEIVIDGSFLPVGNHSVAVSARDDEGSTSSLFYSDVLNVVNIPAEVLSIDIQHRDGSTGPGISAVRGDSMTVTIEVNDPDGPGFGVLATGSVLCNGMKVSMLSFNQKGADVFTARIVTDTSWPIGNYSIAVEVTDDSREMTEAGIIDAFALSTLPPSVLSASATIDPQMRCNASVELVPGQGGSNPIRVIVVLETDLEGGAEETLELSPSGALNTWTVSAIIGIVPDRMHVVFTDDQDRTQTVDWTKGIRIEKGPISPPTGDGGDGSDQVLIIMLASMIALMLLVLIAVLFLVSRTNRYRSAPPMAHPLGQTPLAPVPEGFGLPEGHAHVHALPPGAELLDGATYHAPASKVPATSPRIKVQGEIEKTDVTTHPPPIQDDIPFAPLPEEGIINKDALSAPGEDVRNTDGPDIAGDPGQGVPKSEQGQGQRS